MASRSPTGDADQDLQHRTIDTNTSDAGNVSPNSQSTVSPANDSTNKSTPFTPRQIARGFAYRPSPLRGTGLFATRSFTSGLLVATLSSQFSLPWPSNKTNRPSLTDVCTAFAVPSFSDKALRRIFDILRRGTDGARLDPAGLSNLREWFGAAGGDPQRAAETIIMKGAFPPPGMRWGGYVTVSKGASLLNHSCTPNVVPSFDWETGGIRLMATAEIEEGDELTIAYCDVWADRETRWERLRFVCGCWECGLQGEDLERSDDERDDMGERFRKIMQLRGFCGVRQWDVFGMDENMADFLRGLPREQVSDAAEAAMEVANLVQPSSVEVHFAWDTAAALITARAMLKSEQDSNENALSLFKRAFQLRVSAIHELDKVVGRKCAQRTRLKEQAEVVLERIKAAIEVVVDLGEPEDDTDDDCIEDLEAMLAALEID